MNLTSTMTRVLQVEAIGFQALMCTSNYYDITGVPELIIRNLKVHSVLVFYVLSL